MNIDQLKQQQIQLLAQKTLITDQLKSVEQAIGQTSAIIQFIESQPAPEAPEAVE